MEEEEKANLDWTMPKSPQECPLGILGQGAVLCPGTMVGSAKCSSKKGETFEGSEGGQGSQRPVCIVVSRTGHSRSSVASSVQYKVLLTLDVILTLSLC